MTEPTTLLGHTSRPLAHLPDNINEGVDTLWRYMDYWKYEKLIETRSLYLAKSAEQQDPWEGRYVDLQVPPRNANVARTMGWLLRWTRERLLMSCWSEVERENRRMWDEYTDSTHSVLIRTTAHRLINSLTYARYIALHRIQYSDKPYLEACEPGISEITRTSLLYKTDSFSWEREVRLLAEPDIRISKVTSNIKVSWDPSVHGDPKQLHVEPRILIDQVRTHPDSDQSLRDRLQALHADHGLTVPVRPSVLERDHTRVKAIG